MEYKQFTSLVQKMLFLCILFSFQATAQTYTSGESYFDDNGYVEYIAGNLPIIISAPHNGALQPAEIPDRNCTGCVYLNDSYTRSITQAIQAEFVATTGYSPHVIINHLHRKKFDANRDIDTAADGNATVEQSWYAYHDFVADAKDAVIQEYGRGLFLDIHGHAHDIYRIEFGYGLSRSNLQLSDAELNTSTYLAKSCIQSLANNNVQNLTHAELLRGLESIGALVEEEAFPAVPSFDTPFPLSNEDYFSGGYNTIRHGSREGGMIDAIQVELDSALRFTASARAEFAVDFPKVVMDYLEAHYFDCKFPTTITPTVVSGNCAYIEFDEIIDARKYKLWYREKGVGAEWIERLPTVSRLFLNELIPNTTYELKMKSLCSGPYASVWSSVQDFTTMATLCDRPTTVSVADITSSGAILGWSIQSDDDKYKINYRKQGTPNWISTTTNNTNFLLTGLQANTKYFYKVKTKCPSGLWTNWPSKQFFFTAASIQDSQDDRTLNNEKDVRLYPNPTTNILNIELNRQVAEQIRVTDINGKVIQEISSNEIGKTIDISMLNNGVYFINIITTEQKIISEKFVKINDIN